jgi:hypothetical protein
MQRRELPVCGDPAEPPAERDRSPLVERHLLELGAVRGIASVELVAVETGRQRFEAGALDATGVETRRREHHIVAAVSERAREWYEWQEVSVRGHARKQDPHSNVISGTPPAIITKLGVRSNSGSTNRGHGESAP